LFVFNPNVYYKQKVPNVFFVFVFWSGAGS